MHAEYLQCHILSVSSLHCIFALFAKVHICCTKDLVQAGLNGLGGRAPFLTQRGLQLNLPSPFATGRMWYKVNLKAEALPRINVWPKLSAKNTFGPVSWDCRIHWQLLCRGVRLTYPQRMSCYDTKQSDGEAPVMLELWRMWTTPLLSSLPDPL